MSKSKKLYIARCMVDMKNKKCKNICDHVEPHKKSCYCSFSTEDLVSSRCYCIPVPFEYYIKEILNERK